MTKSIYLLFTALVAVALVTPAVAQAQPWTGTPAAAVIDEGSQGIYEVSLTSLTYNTVANSTAPITAYYNVTDTTGTGNPSWNTIELQYVDSTDFPTDNFVRASLYQTSSTGSQTLVGNCTSTVSASPTQKQCTFTSGAVNFNAGHTYVVRVTLDRTTSAYSVIFYGVRIF
jgi:hypothetical protein